MGRRELLHSRIHDRRVWAAVAATLVGTAVAASLLLSTNPAPRHSQPSAFVSRMAPPLGVACEHAYTSLSAIAARHPGEALIPNTPIANRHNMRFVIWCPEPELVQVYQSGVRITIGPNRMRDAAHILVQTAAQNPTVTLTTINGDLAIQADPAQDPSGRLKGGVEYINDGIDIEVYGNGKIALADLKAVAKSIARYQ